MGRTKMTENQLVASAATQVMDQMYSAYANYLWSLREYGQVEQTREARGYYLGMQYALSILLGAKHNLVDYSIYMNGSTLIAINIFDRALYRSYTDGVACYYTLNPKDKVLEPVSADILNRDWIMLDPFIEREKV